MEPAGAPPAQPGDTWFGRVNSKLDLWGRQLESWTQERTKGVDASINARAKPASQGIEGVAQMVTSDIAVARQSSWVNYEKPLFPADAEAAPPAASAEESRAPTLIIDEHVSAVPIAVADQPPGI